MNGLNWNDAKSDSHIYSIFFVLISKIYLLVAILCYKFHELLYLALMKNNDLAFILDLVAPNRIQFTGFVKQLMFHFKKSTMQ